MGAWQRAVRGKVDAGMRPGVLDRRLPSMPGLLVRSRSLRRRTLAHSLAEVGAERLHSPLRTCSLRSVQNVWSADALPVCEGVLGGATGRFPSLSASALIRLAASSRTASGRTPACWRTRTAAQSPTESRATRMCSGEMKLTPWRLDCLRDSSKTRLEALLRGEGVGRGWMGRGRRGGTVLAERCVGGCGVVGTEELFT